MGWVDARESGRKPIATRAARRPVGGGQMMGFAANHILRERRNSSSLAVQQKCAMSAKNRRNTGKSRHRRFQGGTHVLVRIGCIFQRFEMSSRTRCGFACKIFAWHPRRYARVTIHRRSPPTRSMPAWIKGLRTLPSITRSTSWLIVGCGASDLNSPGALPAAPGRCCQHGIHRGPPGRHLGLRRASVCFASKASEMYLKRSGRARRACTRPHPCCCAAHRRPPTA